jgi:hypothetical protein
MSYAIAAEKSRSEKVVLCFAEAVTQFKIFTSEGGSIYSKQVDHWVKSVSIGPTPMTEVATSVLNPNEWFFDAKAKKLYVRMIDDSNPKTKQVIVIHKFFFSNSPFILPCDLTSGEPVEFEPIINSIGQLGQQLDEENTGIVLESSSNIELTNTHGFFDDIYDTLMWENMNIEFYSWFPDLEINLAKRIFKGVITEKSYDANSVKFTVKDLVSRLKNQVSLDLFSDFDGKMSDSALGKPKRRIFGQADQVQAIGIDNVLEGFHLDGIISVANGSKNLVGLATHFLDQLSPGDEIFVTVDGISKKITIDTVTNDNQALLGSEADVTISGLTAIVKPKIGYRKKNRKWHIAGHKLRAPVCTITGVAASNRMVVDSAEDFGENDVVTSLADVVTIRRVSGRTIVFNSALSPAPNIGDLIYKNPVQKVFYKDKELVFNRDWILDNVSEAIINIDVLAEFNIATQRTVSMQLLFTASSRTVTTAINGDLRTILKPRDWIRKDKPTESQWYEILDVKEKEITLRTACTGTTETITALMKNVDVILDDSLITVNCLGLESEGVWIKTASDAVKYLVEIDAGFTDIDTASFDQAKADCPYILSMIIPEDIGGKAPVIKEVITKINESVFGSLFSNANMEISYSVLNAKKPTNLLPVEDHDILNWKVGSVNKIVNRVVLKYRPFVDIFTGDQTFKTVEFQSNFVDRTSGIQNTEERDVCLYETSKATIIAQRLAFFLSQPTCSVTVTGKMNLVETYVNDKFYVKLDRMYRRYGGRDRLKIGSVTGVKKNGTDVEVEFTDLGNIFNRVSSIAPSGAPSYTLSDRDQIARYGYILDNDTLTPDNTSEGELGNNLIG